MIQNTNILTYKSLSQFEYITQILRKDPFLQTLQKQLVMISIDAEQYGSRYVGLLDCVNIEKTINEEILQRIGSNEGVRRVCLRNKMTSPKQYITLGFSEHFFPFVTS
ncbi:Hypothetical_protein [Hexamita inflata]|uniref:Hypothetical_protein n=1 Tax=Hexamita inflata TaxID=28002 RepID=A0AA86N466_9EUKA|nr:Hypothetical protein HINF_LOCUS83 [Hexamita inflata]CAI9956606.1 Hypothetical protein HINF_LOCUS44251 [Hexamita inflata]CAI9956608.1 Hypothetical protein HINF_LOCUS44253 [Hexamita inflata]CAI9956610.1 Hypothetical protein HINF_LOCUS44255 [Hexamita inflata]CAI9956612.1 Hypothetical protein HINF_LOCUS44257 [Hexamita inflata]